ncbi:MAG: helix-turn-helix domain-containing protein [Prevotella sp.]|jgi:transcriptional regulator with XRE-family HTH domain|nr:helix-turn-helix domain-containing protein [Prevotella sp.]
MKNIVSKNLKKFRESSGLTQEKVASFLGIDRSAYANYEAGCREMPYNLEERVSDLYGIAPILLYEEDEQKINTELVCAFRTDNLSDKDLKGIADFKKIVKNYLKIGRLSNA